MFLTPLFLSIFSTVDCAVVGSSNSLSQGYHKNRFMIYFISMIYQNLNTQT